MYVEVVENYSKNKSSIYKVVEKAKEIWVALAVTPQTGKVLATVFDTCLVKMEKAVDYGVWQYLWF
jgi:hypothetical protein